MVLIYNKSVYRIKSRGAKNENKLQKAMVNACRKRNIACYTSERVEYSNRYNDKAASK